MKPRIRLSIAYEIIMCALALAVVVTLFIEFIHPLTERQKEFILRMDLSILAVFFVDYFVRLFKAENKLAFVKGNIPDLISIIPFDKVFRIARLARLFRLARLTRTARMTRTTRVTRGLRLFKLSVYTNKTKNKLQKVKDKHGEKKMEFTDK